MVLFGFTSNTDRILMASMVMATPAALSTAPLLACHESRCAPVITISGFFAVPGISPNVLYALLSLSWNCAVMLIDTVGVLPSSRRRCNRL